MYLISCAKFHFVESASSPALFWSLGSFWREAFEYLNYFRLHKNLDTQLNNLFDDLWREDVPTAATWGKVEEGPRGGSLIGLDFFFNGFGNVHISITVLEMFTYLQRFWKCPHIYNGLWKRPQGLQQFWKCPHIYNGFGNAYIVHIYCTTLWSVKKFELKIYNRC